MRHSVDEWKSLAMPDGVSERQLNEWQAQVIIDAVADICELVGDKADNKLTLTMAYDQGRADERERMEATRLPKPEVVTLGVVEQERAKAAAVERARIREALRARMSFLTWATENERELLAVVADDIAEVCGPTAPDAPDYQALAGRLHKQLERLVYASEALARKEYKHDGCTFESVALAEQEDATKALLHDPAVVALRAGRHG